MGRQGRPNRHRAWVAACPRRPNLLPPGCRYRRRHREHRLRRHGIHENRHPDRRPCRRRRCAPLPPRPASPKAERAGRGPSCWHCEVGRRLLRAPSPPPRGGNGAAPNGVPEAAPARRRRGRGCGLAPAPSSHACATRARRQASWLQAATPEPPLERRRRAKAARGAGGRDGGGRWVGAGQAGHARAGLAACGLRSARARRAPPTARRRAAQNRSPPTDH